MLAVSIALASQTTSLLAFQFLFGVMVGGSIAAIFAPMMATVTGWFDAQREPCRVAGVGRHGGRADDHVTAGGMARLCL